MNERIRKLAVQAHVKGNTLHYYNPEFIEKFAELIVKDCIRLCDQVDLVGADDCIDNIKEYFGVEL